MMNKSVRGEPPHRCDAGYYTSTARRCQTAPCLCGLWNLYANSVLFYFSAGNSAVSAFPLDSPARREMFRVNYPIPGPLPCEPASGLRKGAGGLGESHCPHAAFANASSASKCCPHVVYITPTTPCNPFDIASQSLIAFGSAS